MSAPEDFLARLPARITLEYGAERLHITDEGGKPRSVALVAFLTANAEDEDTCARARALAPGEVVRLGGGACPLVTVKRLDGRDPPLWLELDPIRLVSNSQRESAAFVLPTGTPYRLAHVMSRPAGGEVRGYFVTADGALLRYPAYPEAWPELDQEITERLGLLVLYGRKP